MITIRCLLEIIQHESIVLTAYHDSRGKLTWGVGVTDSSGHRVNRYVGKTANLQKCLDVFVWLIVTKYAPRVVKALGPDLKEHQLGAALSFEWNTGGIDHATWVEKWKEGKIDEAKAWFMAWDQPKEIIPRRQSECDLFFGGPALWAQRRHQNIIPKVDEDLNPLWNTAYKQDVRPELRNAMRKAAKDYPEWITLEDEPAPPAKPRTSLWAIIAGLFGLGGGASAAAFWQDIVRFIEGLM